RTNRLAQLGGDAALLAVRIAPQRVLAAEPWRERGKAIRLPVGTMPFCEPNFRLVRASPKAAASVSFATAGAIAARNRNAGFSKLAWKHQATTPLGLPLQATPSLCAPLRGDALHRRGLSRLETDANLFSFLGRKWCAHQAA